MSAQRKLRRHKIAKRYGRINMREMWHKYMTIRSKERLAPIGVSESLYKKLMRRLVRADTVAERDRAYDLFNKAVDKAESKAASKSSKLLRKAV